MRKLPEVQEAKELMTEAMDWSTFKWMYEKPRVRKTADRANAALDRLDRAVKTRWSDEVKATYKSLSAKTAGAAQRQEKDPQQPESGNSQLRLLIENVKEADVAAHRARMDAEKTFDEAERRLSTSMAREGCKKAIHSWELHEKAIRKAEAVAGTTHADE
jgi:hypothetical protein